MAGMGSDWNAMGINQPPPIGTDSVSAGVLAGLFRGAAPATPLALRLY